MWFKNAVGREKILYMFNNELSIQNIEFFGFSMDYFSTLKFQFYSKEIPSNYPEKWTKESFNALSLIITLGDLIHLDVTGTRVGFFCSPQISSSIECSEIRIKHGDFHLYCKAKFLSIESITPYIDERWD